MKSAHAPAWPRWDWIEISTMKQFLNFINGEFVATTKTFDKRAPVDNRVIGAVHEAGQAEVDAAVAAARAALKGPWGKLTVVQRVPG